MSDTVVNILSRLGLLGLAKGATAAAQATVTTVDADHNALDVSVRGTPALAADAATATLQGTGNGFLQTLAGIVSAGRAAVTEASAASILAKLSSDPSTATLQTTGNTSLAAILAKIIAAPATEAKQDTGNTSAATTATNTGTIAGAVSAPDATLPASAAQIGGVASTAAPSAVTSGRGVRAWFSLVGAQMVGLLGANGSAIATGANPVPMQLSSGATLYTGATAALSLPIVFAPSLNASNTTLATTGVTIKAGAGSALWITITNTTGSSVYWQIFDGTSTPSNGARAIASAPAITANNGSRAGDLIGPTLGLGCSTGIFLILSLSPTTYSAVASNSCSYAIAYT